METLEAIRQAAKTITMEYMQGDGRNVSAFKEDEYLTKLQNALEPNYKFEKAKPRHWYDFNVDGICIDLKMTDMKSADNAWNQKRLIFTWGGKEPPNKDMNMNEMWDILKNTPRVTERNPLTELYYLAVDKKTGDVLLKSLVDIHTYVINAHPSNVIQINWEKEFENKSYVAPSRSDKMVELAKAVQESVRRTIESRKDFATAEIV